MAIDGKIGEGKYVISVDSTGAITQLQQFDDKVKKTSKSASESFRQAATSAVSLASGIGSLYFQYDNLEKVQLRIRKSSLEVSKAQEEVNKLTNQGKTNTLDYQQAVERLNIAKERNKILTDDMTQAQVALGFSFAQTALSIPTTIASITALTAARSANTAATAASTTANWANTFSLLANPIFAAATAASIAAAVALVATNTWGLRDAIFGTTETVDANTEAMRSYNGELSAYGQTATSATSVTRDLNNEMDRTINNLKKNEISDELEKVKAEMLDGIFIMGSLEQVYNNFKSAGVEGFVREIAKDNRTLDNVNKVKSAVISLYSIINGKAIPNDALGPNVAQSATDGFIRLGAMRLPTSTTAFSEYQRGRFLSYSRASGGGISYLGGQANTVKGTFASLGGVNMTGTASQRLMSGLRTIKNKPRHGGMAEKRNQFDTMATSFFGGSLSLDAANTQAQRTVDLLTAEGIDIPNYRDFGMWNGARGGKVSFNQAGFDAALGAAISEAQRRRQAREDAILGLASRSGLSRSEVIAMQTTQQGTEDLYGIIDYRERLARASTGTG